MSIASFEDEYDELPPKEAVNLLSLDGGGMRGVTELTILHEIMIRLKIKTQATRFPKPCDYFDLIGGTGTGGLLAIMLGRLRMDTEHAMDTYLGLMSAVFRDQAGVLLSLGPTWIRSRTLEKHVKELVVSRVKLVAKERRQLKKGPMSPTSRTRMKHEAKASWMYGSRWENSEITKEAASQPTDEAATPSHEKDNDNNNDVQSEAREVDTEHAESTESPNINSNEGQPNEGQPEAQVSTEHTENTENSNICSDDKGRHETLEVSTEYTENTDNPWHIGSTDGGKPKTLTVNTEHIVNPENPNVGSDAEESSPLNERNILKNSAEDLGDGDASAAISPTDILEDFSELNIHAPETASNNSGEERQRLYEEVELKGKTFVCASQEGPEKQVHRFRSYAVQDNTTPSCKIWQAVHATMTMPRLFDKIKVDNIIQPFMNGALYCMNPAEQVIGEAKEFYGLSRPIGIFLSLGCGERGRHFGARSSMNTFERRLQKTLIDMTQQLLKEAEEVYLGHEQKYVHPSHDDNSESASSERERFYYRFNVPARKEVVHLNEWDMMDKVKANANAYFKEEQVSAQLDEVVAFLAGGSNRGELILLKDI